MLKGKKSYCVCREFLTFNTYSFNSSFQIWVRYFFVNQKSLKLTFKIGFRVQNHLFNLCNSLVILKRLLCGKKAGVKKFVLKLAVIIFILRIQFLNKFFCQNSNKSFVIKPNWSFTKGFWRTYSSERTSIIGYCFVVENISHF